MQKGKRESLRKENVMKRIVYFLLMLLCVCLFAACGKSDMQENPKDSGHTGLSIRYVH